MPSFSRGERELWIDRCDVDDATRWPDVSADRNRIFPYLRHWRGREVVTYRSIADRCADDSTGITVIDARRRRVDRWEIRRQFRWFNDGERGDRFRRLGRLRSWGDRYRGRGDRRDRLERQRTTRVGKIRRRENRRDEDRHDDGGVRTNRNSESPGPHRPPWVKASPAGLLRSTPCGRAGSTAWAQGVPSGPAVGSRVSSVRRTSLASSGRLNGFARNASVSRAGKSSRPTSPR